MNIEDIIELRDGFDKFSLTGGFLCYYKHFNCTRSVYVEEYLKEVLDGEIFFLESLPYLVTAYPTKTPPTFYYLHFSSV